MKTKFLPVVTTRNAPRTPANGSMLTKRYRVTLANRKLTRTMACWLGLFAVRIRLQMFTPGPVATLRRRYTQSRNWRR